MWWPAFLLAILDTAIPYRELLTAHRSAYDPQSGNLSVGLLTYTLTPQAAAGINAICDDDGRDRLFPWPWDNGKHFYTLARRFEQIVKDAELPRARRLFDALQIAARQRPDIVEALDLSHPFVLKIRRTHRSQRRKGTHCAPVAEMVAITLPNNLFEFFDRTYARAVPCKVTKSTMRKPTCYDCYRAFKDLMTFPAK